MSKLQEVLNFRQKIAEFEAELRKSAETNLAEIFKELFDKHQGLRKIVYQGYTPSFNDGEPCEHSSLGSVCNVYWMEYYKGEGQYLSGDDLHEQYEEFFELESDEETYYIKHANSECLDLDAAEQDVTTLSEIIDIVYYTNFVVYITLEDDGSVTVESNEYDCGY
jgi:hypothetical protein